jgi:hypothetical protein
MTDRRLPANLFLAATLIGCAAAVVAGLGRFKAEMHNRRVELAVEYAEVHRLAQITHTPISSVLMRLKRAGAGSVAVTEDTFETLQDSGRITVMPLTDGASRVTVGDAALWRRVRRALNARGMQLETAAGTADRTEFADTRGQLLGSVAVTFAVLRPLGVGMDAAACADVKSAGMQVLARISNFPGATPAAMTDTLRMVAETGARSVIFQGLEVLGYRGQYREAAAALKSAGLLFGQVEFGKQKGDESLAKETGGGFHRVHSIAEGEMGLLDNSEAVDRFVRAARERNIRLCYIRLLTFTGADPVQANAAYIAAISAGIRRGGEMGIGPAKLYENTAVPLWAAALAAFGTAGGVGLLLLKLAPTSVRPAAAGFGISAVLLVAAVVVLGETGSKIAALAAALIFPTLACIRGEGLQTTGEPPTLSRRAAAAASLGTLLRISAVTSAGIVLVVGLLASRSFMVKTNQFMGIKAAHALPILLLLVLAITGLPHPQYGWAPARERLLRFLAAPLQTGGVLVGAVAVIALAMVVMRTGNEPGVGVSGAELKFRALLDRFLPVRPRTKEFLIGHPAMVLGLAMWYRGRLAAAVPLYLVGVIGQVSLLNTFCHIHTPLYLSALRDIIGLVFGTALGLAAFWVLDSVPGLQKDAGTASGRWAEDGTNG